MNTPINDEGPAFPTNGGCSGLTKREWFAGMALQGLMVENGTDTPDSNLAAWAYAAADAMLLAGLNTAAPPAREGVDELAELKRNYAELSSHHNQHCTCNEIY